MELPEKLNQKLETRRQQNALRELPQPSGLVDFASNDYLGFSRSETIFDQAHALLEQKGSKVNGATGSRLLSGNHPLYSELEDKLADIHRAGAALVFNSGYDANVGFFSCVPQKGDIVLYDELCHASIRDGIQLCHARAYKFAHNDPDSLADQIARHQADSAQIYVVTESVFSMDGDVPPLEQMVAICEKTQSLLVVDEAHALGVFGTNGLGLLQESQLESRVFARIMTFGKGLGCHGAAILGSSALKSYLVNFARSFIYTTGLSPHALATIIAAYEHLQHQNSGQQALRDNITHFNQTKNLLGLKPLFVYSKSAIQCAIVPGNEKAKALAETLRGHGFDVRAILSPTVPGGQERLRICLHSYNTQVEISAILEHIQKQL